LFHHFDYNVAPGTIFNDSDFAGNILFPCGNNFGFVSCRKAPFLQMLFDQYFHTRSETLGKDFS